MSTVDASQNQAVLRESLTYFVLCSILLYMLRKFAWNRPRFQRKVPRGELNQLVEHFQNEWCPHCMFKPTLIRAAIVLFLTVTAGFGQSPADGLVEATKSWLKNVSAGSRAELLASTDDRFIATTPAGDVLVRERLIPSDTSQSVQRLSPMELDAPLARVIGETGIVMSRLRPSDGPVLNATFVFVRQQSAWKLAAMHLSPVGR